MSLIQRRILFFLFLGPLLSLSGPKVVQAQGPLNLMERQGEYKVGKDLTYLEDPLGNLTIEDVTSPQYAAQFRQSSEEVPNFGFTNSAYWVRFEVQNQARLTPVWLLELAFGNVHHLDLYLPSPDQQGFQVKHAGNLLPFNSREFAYHNPVFKLPLALNQTTTIYLRAKNDSATFFPLTIWSPETFAQKRATAELGWGFFYGILLILLGYNFLLFLSLRDKAYLSLPVFILSYLIEHSAVHGFTTQYLWPTVGGVDLFSVPFFMGLGIVTGLDFLMVALDTKIYVPTLHKIASFLKWPVWLFISLIPFVSYGTMIKLFIDLLVLICFFVAWTSLRVALRGYQPARYFILGLLVITIREVLVNFVRSDLIPTNEALEWSFEFLVMLVMFLFSLTLVDRVNMLHQEKEQAKDKEAALREREELFRSMFENHSAVMYLVNPEDGQIVEANKAAEHYYGYSLAELKNLTIYAIDQLSPAKIQQKLLQIKTSKRKAFQIPHRLANGEIRTVEVYSTPIKFREQNLLFSIVHDITERKQVEEALKKSEEQYRLLADNSTDVIWLMNLDSKFTYVSPSVEKLRGYTPQEVLQQPMEEVMTPASLASVKEQITNSVAAIRESNKSFVSGTREVEQPCKDGRTVWTEAVVTVLFDEAGKISGFLGVSRDITKRKQDEEALRESELKFKVMSNSAQDAIIMMDPQGHISFWNEAANRIFGYPSEEALGKHLHRLLAPASHLSVHEQKIEHFLATGQGKAIGMTLELEAIRKGGETFPIEISMSALQLKGQWHALGILRDITERKRTEEALRRSEEQYRLLAENSTDVIWLMNLAGILTYVSPSVEKLRGYTPQEILQQTKEEMIPAPLALIIEEITHSFSAPQNFGKPFVHGLIELEQPCKDGHVILTEVLITLLFNEVGNLTGFLGVSRDITERKQFEKQLQEANDRFCTELAFARTIQQNLLQPPRPAWSEPKAICFSVPAREVGGDFYNYAAFPSSEGETKYTFAVGDVTGKGMPAALFMAVSIALLRSSITQELSPSLLLANLDQQLESYTNEDLMNCALCYIEITLPTAEDERGRARVANGGLIPPFFKSCTGQAELLDDVAGPPLGTGLGAMLGYPEKDIELAPGAMLILSSDGLVEAMNPQGELLGLERTLAMIQAGPTDAEAMLLYLQTEILTFMDGAEPHDDITIVVVQL